MLIQMRSMLQTSRARAVGPTTLAKTLPASTPAEIAGAFQQESTEAPGQPSGCRASDATPSCHWHLEPAPALGMFVPRWQLMMPCKGYVTGQTYRLPAFCGLA